MASMFEMNITHALDFFGVIIIFALVDVSPTQKENSKTFIADLFN
jgi:hypothetical protein